MPNNSAIFTYDGVNGVGSFGAPAACVAAINTRSGDYTPTASDYVIHFTGSATCTLDSTLPVGTVFMVKVCAAATVNLVPSSGQIDGVASFPLLGTDAGTVLLPSGNPVYYPAIKAVFDGTNWWAHGYHNVVHKHVDTPSGGFIAPIYDSTLLTGLTTPTSPNVPLVSWTAPAAGLYRLSATIFPTTLNSGAWTVEVVAEFSNKGQAGSNTLVLASCALAAGSAGITPSTPGVVQLASGAVVKFCTVAVSGTMSGGIYSVECIAEAL